MTAGLSALLRDASALVREVTAMFAELRGLARDFRQPDAPKPHPWDASPLPSADEVSKAIGEELGPWGELAKACEDPVPPPNGAVPVSAEHMAHNTSPA